MFSNLHGGEQLLILHGKGMTVLYGEFLEEKVGIET